MPEQQGVRDMTLYNTLDIHPPTPIIHLHVLHGTVDFVQANKDNNLTIVEEHAPVYTLYNLVYISCAI